MLQSVFHKFEIIAGKLNILVIAFVFFSLFIRAQKDSAVPLVVVGIHGGGELPGGDMVKRYGPDLTAGGMVFYKTKTNWLFGVESNYQSGSNVKDDLARQLKNSDGNITDNAGYPSDIRLTERGVNIQLLAGKIIPVTKTNLNSGIMFTFGAGYMQHKIHFYSADDRTAAFSGTLQYGYDRLTVGISLNQFIGYMYLSRNRYANFYAGFTFIEGFTHSLRGFNYDTAMPDTRWRTDVLSGMRLGWILPLYKKAPKEFYYD